MKISLWKNRARRFVLMSSVLVLANECSRAADVAIAYFGKGRTYGQTNASTPILKPNPYIFEAIVRLNVSNGVHSANYSQPPFPVGAWRFIPSTPSALQYSWTERHSSQGNLDGAHPAGGYYCQLDTVHDGVRTNLVNLSGGTYPTVPHVANYAAAQTIDPNADFTLQWDAFSGGRTNDRIVLTIFQVNNGAPSALFESGQVPGGAQTINGTATSKLIPAGMLQPGRAYLARLRFDMVLSADLTSYPGEVGLAANFTSTDFYLKTIGVDSNTPPRVVAHYPPPGASGVARDGALIWTFTKPMARSSAYSYGGFATNPAAFFTSDRRSFVLLPQTPHLASTNVSWTLQYWNPFVFFGDTNGNPLFTDITGNFVAGTGTLPPAEPPQLEGPTLTSTAVEMVLHGESNRVFTVQYSTNLSNWSTFSTNVTLTGPSAVSHAVAPGTAKQRFYRAQVLR